MLLLWGLRQLLSIALFGVDDGNKPGRSSFIVFKKRTSLVPTGYSQLLQAPQLAVSIRFNAGLRPQKP